MYNMLTIEGIATFTEKGFRFDSGLPSNEPVLEEAKKLHGTMKVCENGCASFESNNRIYLPPEVHQVGSGEGYTVRRTSRHYIIQCKVPVVETRQQSEERLMCMMPCALGDITLDRVDVLNI